MEDYKIYVGTLYSGENELEECKRSVQSQTFKNITHEVFSFLPNKEAHDTLYSRFIELQSEYKYFIKIDADMVFKSDDIIEKMVKRFEEEGDLECATFSVDDWYSNSHIMGLNMYSNRVEFEKSDENLFVDHAIKSSKTIFVWDNPAPVAYHGNNPSIEEAFLFGYHRSLKVIQKGKLRKRIRKVIFQMDTLKQAWEQLKIDKTIKRVAVIYGAEYAFRNPESELTNKSQIDIFKQEVDRINNVDIESFIKENKSKWDNNGIIYLWRKFKYINFFKYTYPIMRVILNFFRTFRK